MKICFWVNSMYKLGGEQRITTLIANNLVAEGYDVSIIIKHKEDRNFNPYNLSEKIKIYFMNLDYVFNLNTSKFVNKLRIINRKHGIFKNNKLILKRLLFSKKMERQIIRLINDNNFDYVIAVGGDRSFILSSLKKRINAKIIGWNQMNIEPHFIEKDSRYLKELKFILPLFKNFNDFVVYTKNDQKILKYEFNVDSTVIGSPNLVNIDSKPTFRNKKFIAAGRFVYQKGFDTLLECFGEFCKKNNDWELELYGEGNDIDKYLEIIDTYNIKDRVKILPPTDKLIDKYLDSSIYLMTSRYEGWGLVTMEALGCGLPVIAFDIPSNKEMIHDGINGYLVHNFNKEKYVEKMLLLANDEEKIKELSKNIESVMKKFDKKTVIDAWKKILK